MPVYAEPSDLEKLAGDWEGEYSSPTTGRHGSIVFSLAANKDTAAGDVVMTPADSQQPYSPEGLPNDPTRDGRPRLAQLLQISFVIVRNGAVSGTLEPYVDPDCGCTLMTTFQGRMEKDKIIGTYLSRAANSTETHSGAWEVNRKQKLQRN